MPITEPVEALKRLERGGGARSSILLALLGLLFLTAFLPLVLTSNYLVNQARVDLELDQRTLQIAKVRHLAEWIAQFRSSARTVVHTLATSLAIDAPADYRQRINGLAASRGLEAYTGDGSPIVSVNVVDRKGFGARSGLALPEPAIAEGIQAAFTSGLRGETTTTPPLWSTTLSEPVVVSAIAVDDDDRGPGSGRAVLPILRVAAEQLKVVLGRVHPPEILRRSHRGESLRREGVTDSGGDFHRADHPARPRTRPAVVPAIRVLRGDGALVR